MIYIIKVILLSLMAGYAIIEIPKWLVKKEQAPYKDFSPLLPSKNPYKDDDIPF